MNLIQQTLPPEYEQFTNVLYNSVKYKYKNNHLKKFEYFPIHITEIISQVLDANKNEKFLIPEEEEFLDFCRTTFSKDELKIKFEDYYLLINRGFVALEKRIDLIKEKLIDLIKNEKIESSGLDNKYLFIIENTQRQLAQIKELVTDKDFKNKPESSKTHIVRTFLIVIDNFSQIIFTISKKDFENVDEIYDSTLDVWDKKFARLNPDNKILV